MPNERITNIDQIPLFLDVKVFAQILQVSKPTAYRIIQNEKIPTIKISTKIQIRKKDFLNWMVERFEETAC